jgi:hypothetical protein
MKIQKNSKQLLFEMMQKVNPDFKILKEELNYDEYINQIKNELYKLDSGDMIIQVIDQDFTGDAKKYENSKWNNIKNNYFKKNFEKGISPELTAQYLKDSWYGV